MDRILEIRHINIQHKLNSGREHYIKGFFVDGIYANQVFEFYSCHFHGCPKCFEREMANKSLPIALEKPTKKKRLKRTQLRKEYLERQGHSVEEIWECDFKENFRNATEHIRNKYLPAYFQNHKHALTKETLLKDIKNGDLFGIAEVNIEVPTTWKDDFHQDCPPKEFFSEFSPIFCTSDIPMDCIGQHMTEHLEKFQLSLRPRKLLVGGLKAEKIMLATPLLKWYLNHGLVVTDLFKVIEFSPLQCFKTFVDRVTNARRAGDRNSKISLLSETMKLISNSAFGSTIMNKFNFNDVNYVRGSTSAKIEVNKPHFKKINELDDDIFEVEAAKHRIKIDVPIQIGFFVLNYAKLRMLEFYYDFLIKFLHKRKFECIQMDTDSLYFGLSEKSFT